MLLGFKGKTPRAGKLEEERRKSCHLSGMEVRHMADKQLHGGGEDIRGSPKDWGKPGVKTACCF